MPWTSPIPVMPMATMSVPACVWKPMKFRCSVPSARARVSSSSGLAKWSIPMKS